MPTCWNTQKAVCMELYDRIVPQMVDVELRRGTAVLFPGSWAESPISAGRGAWSVSSWPWVRTRWTGIPTMDGMAAASCYTKKEVLSGLLKACYPAKDDAKDPGPLLGGTKSGSRLVEVAMYATVD